MEVMQAPFRVDPSGRDRVPAGHSGPTIPVRAFPSPERAVVDLPWTTLQVLEPHVHWQAGICTPWITAECTNSSW